jgi:hypothetical protein
VNDSIINFFIKNNYLYSEFPLNESQPIISVSNYINNTPVCKNFLEGILKVEHKGYLSIYYRANKRCKNNLITSAGSAIQYNILDLSINTYIQCQEYDNCKKAGFDIFLYNRLGKDLGNYILDYISSLKYHDLMFGEKKKRKIGYITKFINFLCKRR